LATSQKGRGWRGVRTPLVNGRSNEREPGDTGGPINTGLRPVQDGGSTNHHARPKALRARVAPLTNSHVSRKRRAYAVKSGYTAPEGSIYLLLISWMIARGLVGVNGY